MAAIMRGLEAEAYDRTYTDRELVKRILNYFRPYRFQVLTTTVLVFLLAITGAAPPLIIAQGMNVVEEQGETWIVPALIITILLVGILTWFFNWGRRILVTTIMANVLLAMRRDAFAAAAKQDLSFYDQFSSGRVVSRITSDTNEFAQVVEIAMDVISQLATALLIIIILFTIEWRLSLLVVITAPIVSWVTMAFRSWARVVTTQASRAMAEVNRSIQEAVTGISVAKNFRQEHTIHEEFVGVNHQAYEINVRRGFVLASIFPVLNTISGFGTAAIIYLGAGSVAAAIISFSAWYLFTTAVDRFWFPFTNLSAFWSQFQAGLSAVERVFALIDAQPVVVQRDQQQLDQLQGEIRFADVRFQYNEKEVVLPHFSLTIAGGESVALVGHTGAGKSSIIKLVARFYEFQGGNIFIDGHDIRDLHLPDYRRQLGVVSQVPFLFAGTVAENIRYGSPETSDSEIEEMCRQIGNGEWLETLPNGLQSEVGERGNRLSMGQRQLVALVRVMVQKPRIFLLDEATANVDPFTESQIQEALRLIMSNTTSIIIAHRLSTIRSADRIIVMGKGQIIEEGNHEQLMAQKGHYAHLYDTYFRHQSLEYIEQAKRLLPHEGKEKVG